MAIVVVSMTDRGGLADLTKRLASLKAVPTIIVATKHDDLPARQMTMVSRWHPLACLESVNDSHEKVHSRVMLY